MMALRPTAHLPFVERRGDRRMAAWPDEISMHIARRNSGASARRGGDRARRPDRRESRSDR